jgi:hypothetical protein
MSTEKLTNSKIVSPYGAWKSPITAEILTQKNVGFGEIAVIYSDEDIADIVFVENRPQEGGRAALVKKTIDLRTLEVRKNKGEDKGEEIDLTRGKHNARSGVHEYGGGAMTSPRRDTLIYTDYKTFDLYEVEREGEPHKLSPSEFAEKRVDRLAVQHALETLMNRYFR